MTDEKWEQFVELVKDKFRDVELYTEDADVGTEDVLIFTHASGSRYKVVRENRPVVVDTKEFYSHRPGDTARVVKEYSDSEFSHKVRVYKLDDMDEEMEELTPDNLGL